MRARTWRDCHGGGGDSAKWFLRLVLAALGNQRVVDTGDLHRNIVPAQPFGSASGCQSHAMLQISARYYHLQ